jgi:hypothetical protein
MLIPIISIAIRFGNDTKMARRSANADVEIIEQDADEMSSEDRDVEDLLLSEAEQSSETRWNVRVKRVLEDNNEDFLFGCKITDLPLWEKLQSKFPDGGRFRAWITRNGIVYRKIDYRIASTAVPQTHTVAPMTGFEALAEAMQRQTQVIADTVRMAIERPAPAMPTPTDPVQMFAALAGIFVQMQNVAKPTNTPTESPIEYMKLGIELANKAGGGGGETSMLDIFKAALEGPLGQALATQAQERERAMRQPAPQLNQPISQPMPQSIPQPSQPMPNNNPLAPFMQHIESLIVAAEQRKDPEVFAEFLLNTLPQSIWEAMITSNQILDGLCQRIPRLNAQRVWFMQMVDAMRTMVEDEPEAPEASSIAGP